MPSKRERSEYYREYRRKNLEKFRKYSRDRYRADPERTKRYTRKYERENKARLSWAGLVANARGRAKRNGLEFTLTREWLDSKPQICELSGMEFTLGEGRGPRCPSIDRIDSAKGYTPDNCRIICWALNAAFCDWGMEEFMKIMDAVNEQH